MKRKGSYQAEQTFKILYCFDDFGSVNPISRSKHKEAAKASPFTTWGKIQKSKFTQVFYRKC